MAVLSSILTNTLHVIYLHEVNYQAIIEGLRARVV